MQRSARGLVAGANPYYPPLSPNPVFTLAASFIESCPPENAELPFKPFPTLTLDSGSPLAMGMPASFSYDAGAEGSGHYVTFVSGLAIKSVMAAESSGGSVTVTIPEGVEGQSYVFLTSADVSGGPGSLTDAAIVAGPAVIEVTPASPSFDLSYE